MDISRKDEAKLKWERKLKGEKKKANKLARRKNHNTDEDTYEQFIKFGEFDELWGADERGNNG